METISANYDENYFNSNSEKSYTPLNNYLKFLEDEWIEWKWKRICDFWCANWNLINLLHEKSNCYWFDISDDAIKTCKNRFNGIEKNFNVVDINHNIPKCDYKFDIIFLLDVIEHFYNFEYFYEFIDSFLVKWWYLVITTPNSNALTRYILPLNKFTWEIDQTHRVLFTPYTLDFFLRKCLLSKINLSTPYSFYFKNNFVTSNILLWWQIFWIYIKD